MTADNAEMNPRLVVELNARTREDLTWIVDMEEINKTTAVNRAVQVYRHVSEAQRNGSQVAILDRDGNVQYRLWLL